MESAAPSSTPATALDDKMPRPIVWTVVALCVVPFLLGLVGVDFGSTGAPLDLHAAEGWSPLQLADRMHHALAGSFLHTLLEWTACLAAAFTVVFAYAHYTVKRDPSTPVICLAMFWAASMDAFHIMAADRLINAAADNATLIPFTWAVCRIFNALILVIGVGIFTVRQESVRPRPAVIGAIGLVFGLVAYATIWACARSATLPVTTFPNAIFKRPLDLIPLAIYLVAGLVVFPRFRRRHPGLFSSALMLSIVPQIATQLYMVFGSPRLFDSHFNVAHALKSVSYLVPFLGLVLDYVRTYQADTAHAEQLKGALGQLETANRQLWSEMNLAQKIQTVLLPSELKLGGYEASVAMKVAQDVGGDYYDAIKTRDGRYWLFVGDVSGHGVTAGLIMMMFQTAIRTAVYQLDRGGAHFTPADVLNIVNTSVRENLRRINPDAYMTVTALCLDGQQVHHAGKHQDLLVYRAASGQFERIETDGVWLGLMEDTTQYLKNQSFQMNDGDLLFLYTDGITEARRDGKLLEVSGLVELLRSALGADQRPQQLVARVVQEVSGLSPNDDVTLLAMRRSARAPTAEA
jgi:serine phosphatase RsbU (regulator of sigma subunit)